MNKQTSKQNITGDIEIKNKLAVTRGEGEGIIGERKGRVKLRNMYKGPKDKDNGVGSIEVGIGEGRAGESNWGQWGQL